MNPSLIDSSAAVARFATFFAAAFTTFGVVA